MALLGMTKLGQHPCRRLQFICCLHSSRQSGAHRLQSFPGTAHARSSKSVSLMTHPENSSSFPEVKNFGSHFPSDPLISCTFRRHNKGVGSSSSQSALSKERQSMLARNIAAFYCVQSKGNTEQSGRSIRAADNATDAGTKLGVRRGLGNDDSGQP